MHADQNALAWADTRLVVGNDGGVYSKGESDTAWTNHNAGLAISQIYAGGVAGDDPHHMVIATQDNGIVGHPGPGAPWDLLYGGDGVAAAAGQVPGHWFYSLPWVNMLRALTDAANEAIGFDITDTALPFDQPGTLCPANENVLIAGAKRIWRTDNLFTAATGKTVTFSANSPLVSTSTSSMAGIVSAIAVAASDPTCKTYAYATDAGDLFLTTTAGAAWVNLDPGGKVPKRYVTGIAFSPTSASTILVSLSGFDEATPSAPGHVFRTDNAKSETPAWKNISPPVNVPADTVAFGIPGSKTIFAGTDMGLWISNDGGASWAHEAGLPNAPVTDIHVDNCGTTVFTFGRGAFRNFVPYVCP